MEENDYLLVIKLPIKALDDAAAREEAHRELFDMYVMHVDYDTGESVIASGHTVKLQRIVAGQSPEGIPL
jgi:hypothetical protein